MHLIYLKLMGGRKRIEDRELCASRGPVWPMLQPCRISDNSCLIKVFVWVIT